MSSKTTASSDALHENDVVVALSRLAEITEGDPEFSCELIDAFMVSGEEALSGMRAGVQTANANAVKQAAHKLKGAAANLHLLTLAELASRIEAHCGDPRDCGEDVKQIEAQFRRAVELLKNSINASMEPARAAGHG